LVKLGKTNEAEKQIQQIVSKQPELALALLAQGDLQFAKGEYDNAVQTIRHSLDNDAGLSKSADVCFTFAQALEKQGDTIESLEYYKRSIANGLSGDGAASAQ